MEEQELIRKAQKGKRDALEIIYRKHAPRMLSICRRYTHSQMEAEDILQEGFIKVFTKIHTFKSQSPLEKWIERIMVNTALSAWRKNKKLRETQSLEADSKYTEDLAEPEPSVIQNISSQKLYEAIASLPEKYRYVFNLFAIEGYSHRDIAQLLNIQESTSRSQYTRARKKLVQILKPHKQAIQ